MYRTLLVSLLATALSAGVILFFYQSASAAPTGVVQTNKQTDSEKESTKQDKKTPEQSKTREKDDPKKQKEAVLARFMRKKLDASNKVLKGLMTDDFDEIDAGADALLKMSMQERWRVSADPTYARFSRGYQSAVRKLQAKAKIGTVDGSALAWIDVTMSCIECHEWVRNVLIADNDLQLTP